MNGATAIVALIKRGKKGKMTSSSSCEANQTDEGGGENWQKQNIVT